MSDGYQIRELRAEEFERLWPIFQQILPKGESYNYPEDLTLEQARDMWTSAPYRCFVAEDGDEVLGCYKFGPNHMGRGNHIANASYMVAEQARGRGVGSALCEHSLDQARDAGFLAMQFNYVVSTNLTAVRLWQKHGFRVVGEVPDAFRHAVHGFVAIYVMHRTL